MRVTFDSNVLVYAVDADAGDKHAIAIDLIERAAAADCVFTLQSLAEFFFVATRKAGLAAKAAAAFIDDWRGVFPVVGANEASLVRAITAVDDHSLSFWDAMIWATACQANCGLLLSEDLQDGRVLDGLRFINPFAQANADVIEVALPAPTGPGSKPPA